LARNFFEIFLTPQRAFLYLARCNGNRAIDSHDACALLARDYHLARRTMHTALRNVHNIARDRSRACGRVALVTGGRRDESSAKRSTDHTTKRASCRGKK